MKENSIIPIINALLKHYYSLCGPFSKRKKNPIIQILTEISENKCVIASALRGLQSRLSSPSQHNLKPSQLSYAIGLTVLLMPSTNTPENTIKICLKQAPVKTIGRIIAALNSLFKAELISKESFQKHSHFALLSKAIVSDVLLEFNNTERSLRPFFSEPTIPVTSELTGAIKNLRSFSNEFPQSATLGSVLLKTSFYDPDKVLTIPRPKFPYQAYTITPLCRAMLLRKIYPYIKNLINQALTSKHTRKNASQSYGNLIATLVTFIHIPPPNSLV